MYAERAFQPTGAVAVHGSRPAWPARSVRRGKGWLGASTLAYPWAIFRVMQSRKRVAHGRQILSRAALLGIAVLVAAACAAPSVAPPGSSSLRSGSQPVDSALALATFDSAWQRIVDTHFDTAFGGVDWRAVRQELRPEAARARDNTELRSVLRRMVGRLHESHFGIIPREASSALRGDEADEAGPEHGTPGFDMRLTAGQLLVTAVEQDSPAHAAGIRPGWVLFRIGNTDIADALRQLQEAQTELPPRMERMHAWAAVTNRLSGPAGTSVQLAFLDSSDDTVRVSVERAAMPGQVVRFLNLPPVNAHLEHERMEGPGGTTIGVIRFNIWMTPIAPQFARAMDELRGSDGIVIDLRGNIGGVGGMVMGISGHFLDTTVSLGAMRTRTAELRFVSNPQRVNPAGRRVRPYQGPLVIIVDEISASTSEFFAAGLQAVGRARVVGDTTTGQALPAHTYILPNGDVLMHAFADFRDPNGDRIEGRGVIPDEYVPLDRVQLLRGRDAVVEQAVAAASRLSSETVSVPAP